MKQYIITLGIVFATISAIVYGFLSFIYASFDVSVFDSLAKAFAILITIILTGVLTERIKEL